MAGADELTPLNQERGNTAIYQTTDNEHSTTNGNAADEENIPLPEAIASIQLPTSIWTVVTVLSVGMPVNALTKVHVLTLNQASLSPMQTARLS